MTKPTPIPGLNASVLETAQRARLTALLTKMREKKQLSDRELDEFERLFEMFREDAATQAAGGLEEKVAKVKQFQADAPAGRTMNKYHKAILTEQVARWIMDGRNSTEIWNELACDFNLSRSSAFRLIHAAREMIQAAESRRRGVLRAICHSRWDTAYAKALAAGDLAGMCRANEGLAELHGLNAPKQAHLSYGAGWPAEEGPPRLPGDDARPVFDIELRLPDDGSGVTS